MFLKAALVYLICHISSVSQGILTKFATTKAGLSIQLFNFLIVRAVVVMIVLFPFAIKHFHKLKKHTIAIAVLSILAAMDTIFFNLGLRGTAVNLAIIIMFIVPIMINIFSPIILKEKSSISDYFTLIACLIGVFIASPEINPINLIFSKEKINFNFDIIFIFLTVIVVVFGLIFQKKWKDKRPIPLAIFLNAFCLLIFSSLLKEKPILETINHKVIIFGILVAIFDMLDFFSVYKAYQMSDLAKLQPVRFARVIISIVLSYLILKEEPTVNQLIGGSIIIVSNLAGPIIGKIFTKI